MMKKIKQLCCLSFLMTILFTSCVKEDFDDCVINTTRLNFKYFADGEQNVISDYVEEITLLVFDGSTGELIEEKTLSGSARVEDYFIEFKNLQPGEYSFIAWGNMSNQTLLSGSSNLSTAYVSAYSKDAQDPTLRSADRLYYTRKDIEIKSIAKDTYDLNFRSAFIGFEVSVKGLSKVPKLHIDKLVQRLDMNMQVLGGTSDEFMPHVNSEQPNLFVSDFNILKPSTEFLTSTLSLITEQGINHSVNIQDFIRVNYPSISILDSQEIKIRILFDFSDIDVKVTVPDWDIDDNTGSVID